VKSTVDVENDPGHEGVAKKKSYGVGDFVGLARPLDPRYA